jgi:DNA-directed RNA polymerase specialized sigma24 family protein
MQTLFSLALNGDKTAESVLHSILRRIAWALCRKGGLGGTHVDWEEIAQDAGRRFFAAGLHQFRNEGSEFAYLYSIVRTTFLQEVRRNVRHRVVHRAVDHEVETVAHDPDAMLDVQSILRKLPTSEACLLEKVFLHEVSYAVLAVESGILESSVRVRVTRCLRHAKEAAKDTASTRPKV